MQSGECDRSVNGMEILMCPFQRKNNKLKRAFPPPWFNKVEFFGEEQVSKTFRGNGAAERFGFEVGVLRHLNAQGCPFVPQLLGYDSDALTITVSHCGERVPRERFSRQQVAGWFQKLEGFGVRHDDVHIRNMLCRKTEDRIFLIDFEFSTLL